MGNYTVNVTLNGQDNLSDDLNKVNGELNDLETGSGNAEDGISNLTSAAIAMGAAFVANQLVGYISQLNEIGAQANNAERNFVQLSGGADVAAKTLSELQIATRGVVDDTTLMNGANRLLMMNLASTGDEAAKLTGIAVTLGKTMGVDATTAVGDFASMLANQSIPRLDNFGISSGKVRDRIEELKKSGMGMDEAFKTAVLEQGALAIDRLGTAADQGATSVEKLRTRFTNLAQDLGQQVNTAIEAEATTLDQLIQIIQMRSGSHPVQQAAAEDARKLAQSFTDEYTVAISQYMGQTEFDSGEAAQNWYDSIHNAFTSVVNNPTLAKDKDALMAALTDVPDNMKSDMADAIMMSVDDAGYQKAADMLNAKRQADQQAAGTAAAQKYITAFADTWRTGAANVWGTINAIETGLEDTKALDAWKAQQQAIADATTELNTFTNSYSNMPPITNVMDETQTGTLSMMLEDAKTQLADLQEAGKNGVLQDADVAKAQAMVDQMQNMQDRVESIQNMTLGGLLGTSSGGAMGELESKILENAKGAGGLSDRQIEELQNTLDLASGRATSSSQTLDETVVPMITEIANKLGPDAAAVAMKNVTEFIKQGNYLGLDQTTIAANLDEALGFTKTGSKYGLNGDTTQITQNAGFDPAAYANSLADSKTSMEKMSEDAGTLGTNMETVNNQVVDANTNAQNLQSTMKSLTASVHIIKVNLDIQGLDKLNGLGIAAGSGNGVSTNPAHPRNNGGRGSGLDARAD